MGMTTYFLERIHFFSIHFRTFSLDDSFMYRGNHRQSRKVNKAFLSSERPCHIFLNEENTGYELIKEKLSHFP